MFADRQKFNMGETEIAGITRKLLGQIAIAQPLIVALAPPRAEMDFVDRHRRAQRVDTTGAGRGCGSLVSSTTMDAVLGRISAANATGSDFSARCWPCGPMISNL